MPPVFQAILYFLALTAGYYDLRFRRIPNWVSFTGLAAGFGLNTFLQYEFAGLAGLWFSLQGLGLALLVYVPLYLIRAMGAGDVKLMGAIGSVVGAANWLLIFVISSILGGVIAIVLLLSRGRLAKTFSNIGLILQTVAARQAPYRVSSELDVRSEQAVRMPHGAVIALGIIAYLAWGQIFLSR
jgi:prepilin peptidase CpaA